MLNKVFTLEIAFQFWTLCSSRFLAWTTCNADQYGIMTRSFPLVIRSKDTKGTPDRYWICRSHFNQTIELATAYNYDWTTSTFDCHAASEFHYHATGNCLCVVNIIIMIVLALSNICVGWHILRTGTRQCCTTKSHSHILLGSGPWFASFSAMPHMGPAFMTLCTPGLLVDQRRRSLCHCV